MASQTPATNPAASKPASRTSIVLAFASVYFFWGSTYTAIRIGAAEMPALLLTGTRFLIAGAILLAWCRWRGMRLVFPAKTMLMLALIGLLLLGWAWHTAGGFGPMLSVPSKFNSFSDFLKFLIPALNGTVGFWATVSLNIPDFTRFARNQR